MINMTHTHERNPATPSPRSVAASVERVYAKIADVLGPLALLALRLPVAVVFWRSGRTRVEGWNIFDITDSQPAIFEYEFGSPFPVLTAHVTAIAEHVLPVLLVLGLFTRLGGLGMLIMTMVIQFFVYPDAWLNAHMFWSTILIVVIVLGPGKISLDHYVGRWLRG